MVPLLPSSLLPAGKLEALRTWLPAPLHRPRQVIPCQEESQQMLALWQMGPEGEELLRAQQMLNKLPHNK